MKKLIALLVTVFSIVTLVDCGSTTSSIPAPETQNSDTTITENNQTDNGSAQSSETITPDSTQATVLDGLAVQGKTAQESQDSTRRAIQEWLSKSGIND